MPENGSIESIIYQTLCEQDSIINRDLRAACGFSGAKMRSKFDGYVTRLQMATRVVTEDFVYPRDKHNREYGWGWSLLTTPERVPCPCSLLLAPYPLLLAPCSTINHARRSRSFELREVSIA